jgi:hypothetical protein
MNFALSPKSDQNEGLHIELDKFKLKKIPKKNELSQVIGNNQISNIHFDNTIVSDSIKINFDNSNIHRLENYNNNKFKFDIMKKIDVKSKINNINNNFPPKRDSNNSNKISDSGISERLAKINSKIQKYVNN